MTGAPRVSLAVDAEGKIQLTLKVVGMVAAAVSGGGAPGDTAAAAAAGVPPAKPPKPPVRVALRFEMAEAALPLPDPFGKQARAP